MKILVLDDDRTILKGLKRFLEDHSFSVDTYQEGRKALEALKVCDYSCIVSDVDMPSMSGLEFQQEVFSAHPKMQGHFVFHSGNPLPSPDGIPKVAKGRSKELLSVIQSLVLDC